jgi:AbrB family transcriptional regulator, transcriptional pleiotropic regulator of transition state genes
MLEWMNRKTQFDISILTCYYYYKNILSDTVYLRRLIMKSTGIVRKVDELGRVVIPIELRRTLSIGEKDALEIFVEADTIILKKYEPACIFCGQAKGVKNLKGKNICPECLEEMANM